MKFKIDQTRLDSMFPMPEEGDQSDAAIRSIAIRAAVESSLERLEDLIPGLADLLKDLSEGTCSCRTATLRDRCLIDSCLGACREAKARAIIA